MHRLLRYRWSAERVELRYTLSREFTGGSALDIGAHRGVYSYWMHRQFRNATRIVAFEPQAELAEYLSRFRRAFHLERMEVVPLGLSSHSGSRQMHRPRGHWGAATLDEFSYDSTATDVFNVPVTTIDEYLAAHPELRPVQFIKCDVEYHEAEVLSGARETLRADRPELLIEWSTPRRAYRERLFCLMQHLDYQIFQFEFGRLTPCTTPERHSPPSWELSANYVLVPREKAASAAA
jgi:FkbM family methyltransferase